LTRQRERGTIDGFKNIFKKEGLNLKTPADWIFVSIIVIPIIIWVVVKILDNRGDIMYHCIDPIIDRFTPDPLIFETEIIIGVTTREAVTSNLGQPRTFSMNLTGETLTWSYDKGARMIITLHNPPAAPIKLHKQQLTIVLINNVVVSVSS
jgi:hypothetical protein